MLVEPRPAAADRDVVIGVANVSQVYGSGARGVQAIDDVSFEARQGEFLTIVGPSGCGKSSLLMMLAGLLQPTSGTLEFRGRPIAKPTPRDIGLVFQEASLYPWKTALQNVAFPAQIQGGKRAERERQARELLALVGLLGFEESYPHQLSGGMRQRVAIARGLMQQPEVLLMDEPFGALDEQTRIRMGDELLRIWEETKTGVIFVTHSISEAITLSDRVIVMGARPGRIRKVLTVGLPRPRTFDVLNTPEAQVLRQEIWSVLAEDQ